MSKTLAVFQLATFWLNADVYANICTQSQTPQSIRPEHRAQVRT
jgi:hypothetical protein